MNVDNYQIDLAANGSLKRAAIDYPTNQLEKIILILIAAIGLLGSTYIFAASSGSNAAPEMNKLAATALLATDSQDDILAEKFNDYIQISGKKKVGEQLEFEFIGDRSEGRYVLEMGDDMRMIITSDVFPYTYKTAGKMVLELKKIERGLITTIATKKLKVKK